MIFDNKKAVSVASTTKLRSTIKRNTKTPKFPVVTPDQSKFIELIVSPTLSMIEEGNPNLTISLNGFIHKNKPGQRNGFFWFLTKIEDQTPIQTPILIEFSELNEIEKLNLNDKQRIKKQMSSAI